MDRYQLGHLQTSCKAVFSSWRNRTLWRPVWACSLCLLGLVGVPASALELAHLSMCCDGFTPRSLGCESLFWKGTNFCDFFFES